MSPPQIRVFLPVALLAALALVAGGCTVNPATGERQLTLMSEADEIAMGREADQQIVQMMGLYDDPPGVQAYVEGLGQKLAAQSERPHLPWTFRVVDDPTVNAFALPGGFIYVTRGIMAHLNSEAELVAVLGHEIGHVTGRHTVERLSKAQLFSVGLGVGMILSPEFRSVGDLAQTGLGVLFLKFSRDDERQADDLGLRYTIRGGFDPRRMPEVFGVLRRVSEAAGAGRVPGWLSTHPDPEARQERIGEAIAALGQDFGGTVVNRGPYLERLDGMVYGANPREGFFKESLFMHPDLEFRLDFPSGWQTQNQKQAVVGLSPKEDAIVQLTLVEDADPREAARKFSQQAGVEGGRVEGGRIHGFPAAGLVFEATGGERELRGRAAWVRYRDMTFQLLGYTLKDRWSDYDRPFASFINSFDRLTDPKALAVQPARIDVVQLDKTLPVPEFQAAYPSSVPIETVALLNQVTPSDRLPAGEGAKRVVGGELP